MKLYILFFVVFSTFNIKASEEPIKIPLDEMIEMSDAIALVRVVEYNELRNDKGHIHSKNLTVKVIDPILNLKKDEIIVLLEHSGIDGSDLGFYTIGGEAIILMSQLDYQTDGLRTFYSVGFKHSVYRKDSDNCVEGLGLWGMETSYNKAVSKINKKLTKAKKK